MQLKFLIPAARVVLIAITTIQAALGGESSHIYIYADLHAPASSWQPISCDGVIVAKIKRGNFFALMVASGRHTCAIDNGTPALVSVKPNEQVFLRVDEYDIIGEPKSLILSSVPPDLARKDIRWLPYIPSKKILASTVNPADPRAPEEPKFKTRQQDQ